MDIPSGQVHPRAGAPVLVLGANRAVGGRRQRWGFAATGLDTGFLVGRDHKLVVLQSLAFPDAFVEVEDTTRFFCKVWIPWEDPASMAPGTKSIGAEPTPKGRIADLGDQAFSHNFPLYL